jgi:SurA N-terminal domain.
MKFVRSLSIVLVLVFSSGPALSQTRELSSSGELLDRIAAVVNEGVVLRSQLEEQTEQVIARLREQQTELPPRNVLRRQILERLVIEEIQMQRANRLGIQVTDEMLNNTLTDIARRSGAAFDELPQLLAQQGIDYRDFRDDVRRQMTMQLLRQRDVIARINISPRELEQFLARQQNAPDRNADVQRVAHPDLGSRLGEPRADRSARRTRQRGLREGEVRRRLRAARGHLLGQQHEHRRWLARLA